MIPQRSESAWPAISGLPRGLGLTAELLSIGATFVPSGCPDKVSQRGWLMKSLQFCRLEGCGQSAWWSDEASPRSPMSCVSPAGEEKELSQAHSISLYFALLFIYFYLTYFIIFFSITIYPLCPLLPLPLLPSTTTLLSMSVSALICFCFAQSKLVMK